MVSALLCPLRRCPCAAAAALGAPSAVELVGRLLPPEAATLRLLLLSLCPYAAPAACPHLLPAPAAHRYERGKLLIFVSSQDRCDTLFRDLLRSGYPCLR